MNRPGTRHKTSRSRRPANRGDQAIDPDLIIFPRRDFEREESTPRYLGRERNLEYTAYEEIESAPSNVDDELAFQEYADDDPSRLQVSSRRQA